MVTNEGTGVNSVRRRLVVDVSIGEVLYLVLVVAVAWWAFDVLTRHDDRRG